MVLRLSWICRAPTAATRHVAFPLDEPLDKTDRAKAAAVRARVSDHALTAPERRARETAEALGLTADVDPQLRDCDYGRWAGRSLLDLQAAEPVALGAWLSDLQSNPHGGESIADLARRIAAWLEARARDEGRMIAVAHPAVIRAAILHAVGAPLASFWRVEVAPLAIVRLSHDGRRWTLQSIAGPTP
jgi:broad specificity phosphatase PhoE